MIFKSLRLNDDKLRILPPWREDPAPKRAPYWDKLQTHYPDTYDFLKSLENELETMGDY